LLCGACTFGQPTKPKPKPCLPQVPPPVAAPLPIHVRQHGGAPPVREAPGSSWETTPAQEQQQLDQAWPGLRHLAGASAGVEWCPAGASPPLTRQTADLQPPDPQQQPWLTLTTCLPVGIALSVYKAYMFSLTLYSCPRLRWWGKNLARHKSECGFEVESVTQQSYVASKTGGRTVSCLNRILLPFLCSARPCAAGTVPSVWPRC